MKETNHSKYDKLSTTEIMIIIIWAISITVFYIYL